MKSIKIILTGSLLLLSGVTVALKAQDVNNPWHIVTLENEREVASYNTEIVTEVRTIAQQITIALANGREFLHPTATTDFRFAPRRAGTGTANEAITASNWRAYYANGKLYLSETVPRVTIYSVNGTLVAYFTGAFSEVSVDLHPGIYIVQAGSRSAKIVAGRQGGGSRQADIESGSAFSTSPVLQGIAGQARNDGFVSNNGFVSNGGFVRNDSFDRNDGSTINDAFGSPIQLRAGNDINNWWNITAAGSTTSVEIAQVEKFNFTAGNAIVYTLKNGNTHTLATYQKMTFSSTPATTGGKRVEWSHIGIGGGGATYNPTVSPHDPKTVFLTCDMGGSFVTYNGGESWRMFNLSEMANFFVFDPVDPNVVYAQTYALFRSADKGLTWQLFYPKPADVECIVSQGDHASETLVLKDRTWREVQALAIDPEQSKNMYAAIQIDRSLALYSSVDGGGTWRKERDLDDEVLNIFVDPASPANQRSLYVATYGGVEQRVNGQWNHYGAPNRNVDFFQFTGGYDAGTRRFIIYGLAWINEANGTYTGVFISENGGRSWENRMDGLYKYTSEPDDSDLVAIATSAFHPSTLYASYENFVQKDIYYYGVAKSEDFGKTWTLPWQDDYEDSMSNYNWCWLNDRFGSGWGDTPQSIGVSPTNPAVCYTTDYGRVIKTENGGRSWDNVYTRKLPGGSWTTRGIEVTTGYDVVFDPFDTNHLFFALSDIGLMESKNGGQGWLSATQGNGVPRNWVNSTYAIAFDPEVRGRVWAAMSGIHDLPLPKMFRNGIGRFTGGVMRSTNSGAAWQSVSSSIGEAAMTHILLDPTSNRDARTLYACAFGKGVYKSTDGGQTWTQKNRGIEGAEPFAWRIERRASDGTLFLIVSRRSTDGSIGNSGDGALYRSTDGAETWTRITLPAGCNGPTSLIASANRLVLSAWGREVRGGYNSDIGGGIFVSDDDGRTWTQTMSHDQHIYAISYDPRNNRYYACGFNASMYWSDDGARTWTRSRGYNFKWGHRVVPDPRDPEMVFVTTFGGGVWYGPAKGDPEATDDLLTVIERR